MRHTARETQTAQRGIIPTLGLKWTRPVEARASQRMDTRQRGEIHAKQHQYRQLSIGGAVKTKAELGVGDVNASVVVTELIHELELQRETILSPGKLRAGWRIGSFLFSVDEEIVKGMARLFAEMGDAYAEMIATGSPKSMMIVQAVVEVTSHPDYDIAAMTFNFWHSLQLILTRKEYYMAFQNETAINSEKERRLTIFRPIFELLVSLVTFRVTYPQNYNQWSMENLIDFKRTRYGNLRFCCECDLFDTHCLISFLSEEFVPWEIYNRYLQVAGGLVVVTLFRMLFKAA